jgi:hypothetical protein
MKPSIMLALAALMPAGLGFMARAEEAPTKVFTCAIGKKTVSVTSADGRLIYHYGTANKDEMSIVGIRTSGNIFQMKQRFAGMEYQLRFRNGEFNYIVYSNEGNGRVGAAATSGLVIMRGAKRMSDRSCSQFAELVMPADALAIPEDTDTYSAM